MGLEQHEHGNFFSVLDGKFCQRVPQGTEGAIERVNKLGKVVYEKYFDSFVGKLVGIKTKDSEWGKQWLFSFQDKGDVYILQMPFSNGLATAFLKMLPNVDVTKEMKVTPSTKEIDGKKRSSIFINQDGVAIKHAYTKDNPNGLPEWEQVVIKGQTVGDNTKQLAFLQAMVEKDILPKLGQVTSTVPATGFGDWDTSPAGNEPVVGAGGVDEEIPF